MNHKGQVRIAVVLLVCGLSVGIADAQVAAPEPRVRAVVAEDLLKVAAERYRGVEELSRQPADRICGCERRLQETISRLPQIRRRIPSPAIAHRRYILPQVKSEIAVTNRIESRREAEWRQERETEEPRSEASASASAEAEAAYRRVHERLLQFDSLSPREREEVIREARALAQGDSRSSSTSNQGPGWSASAASAESASRSGDGEAQASIDARTRAATNDPCAPQRTRTVEPGELQRAAESGADPWRFLESAPRRSLDGGEGIDPSILAEQMMHRVQQASIADETPTDPIDFAVFLLRNGDVERAAAMCVKLVNESGGEDVEAARLLAMVLLYDRATADGIKVLLEAYRADPSLAVAPLDPEILPGGRLSLRNITNRVVAEAQRDGSPDAWFAAAILNQFQGRYDVASTMLGRAALAGSDAELRQTLSEALARAR